MTILHRIPLAKQCPMPTPSSFLLEFVAPELHELAAVQLDRLLLERQRQTVREVIKPRDFAERVADQLDLSRREVDDERDVPIVTATAAGEVLE